MLVQRQLAQTNFDLNRRPWFSPGPATAHGRVVRERAAFNPADSSAQQFADYFVTPDYSPAEYSEEYIESSPEPELRHAYPKAPPMPQWAQPSQTSL